ncbi:hypothetical protein [Rhodohalobacter sp. 8-1]|uniref:hypothetical protein n=1 Tax=Rhodohalobacter sp. 8-1 TaxID=3131972 RepID=UPI0030EC5045
MARTYLFIIAGFLLSLCSILPANSQNSKSYEFIPAPDIWYNDVDGIRLGIRLKGQVPGTFEDGPHRLDAGLWLGTWFPDLPVSYYLSFTEPIPDWSDFGSEASVQAISSIRTGYSRHGIGFNKRWQQGFDERRYKEISLFNTYEKRFDKEYAAFPALWSDDDKLLTTLEINLQDNNALGYYTISLSGALQYANQNFGFGSVTAVQRVPFNENWGVKLRGFAGTSSASTAPEYLYARSTGPAVNTLSSGVTRAKGTIPQPWIESGNFHIAGGANLRGYTQSDVHSFLLDRCEGCVFENPDDLRIDLFRSIAAVNAELDYPNPIKSLFNRIPYAADFITLRSYLFFDAGSTLGSSDSSDSIIADGGAGFALSLNIPDYLGKPRGFVIRYDIPFWVSNPDSGDPFEFRSLVGFGAVLSF